MRVFWSLALAAGVVLAATGGSPADEKKSADKEKKLMLPDLKAKEWKKTDSGLEIWDVKEGKGDAVKAGARVKVHYTGWLTDGKIFDSSVQRGEPIEFPLTGVIKGWQEGIPGMKPGGVRRLKIPPELAYGKRGAPGAIPPDSTLVFEVELLEIK
jgi:FKBP-type peptidyl-prolyl cis-trans isomerase